jgi:hypothetical protein
MENDSIASTGLIIYFICLFIPIFVSYRTVTALIKKTGSFWSNVFIGNVVNCFLYICLVIIWLIFCFNAPIESAIEPSPMIGILLGVAAAIISSFVLSVFSFFKRKRWTNLS